MTAKTTACRILDTLKLPYTLHDYEWAEEALDVGTVAGKLGIPSSHIFKTLVLKGNKTGVLMACVPGNQELDLKSLALVSGNKKVEMVPVKDLQSLTGYVRGGVSPLGVKKKYPLFIDHSVQGLDTVSISAGRRGTQIFLSGLDFVCASKGMLAPLSK